MSPLPLFRMARMSLWYLSALWESLQHAEAPASLIWTTAMTLAARADFGHHVAKEEMFREGSRGRQLITIGPECPSCVPDLIRIDLRCRGPV